jgi:hypothetical protein
MRIKAGAEDSGPRPPCSLGQKIAPASSGLTRGGSESVAQHRGKHHLGGAMVAAHRHHGGAGNENSVGSWLDPNERRKPVPHGAPVGELDRRAPVAVGEGVDADPFAVGIGTRAHDRRDNLGRRRGADRRDSSVKRRHHGRGCPYKGVEGCRDVPRRQAAGGPDGDLVVDQAREARIAVAHLADIVGMRHADTVVDPTMPLERESKRRRRPRRGVGLDHGPEVFDVRDDPWEVAR